jgi:hypothetical protein
LEDIHLEDRDGNGRTDSIKTDLTEIGSEDGSFMELTQDHVFLVLEALNLRVLLP